MRVHRHSGLTTEPRAGLSVDSPVPREVLAAHLGSQVDDWLKGPSLLVFLSDGCPPCHTLLNSLGRMDLSAVENRMLMVHAGPDGSRKSLQKSAQFDATWASDPKGRLEDTFQTDVFPHTFAIHNGVVVAQAMGDKVEDLLSVLRLSQRSQKQKA